MALTGYQIELIESSFQSVKFGNASFSARFYSNLFQAFPEYKPLFVHDQKKQEYKFAMIIQELSTYLHTPNRLNRSLQHLGIRHRHLSLHAADFENVGQIFIKTIAEVMGSEWSPELGVAWLELYTIASDEMQKFCLPAA